MTDQLRSEQFMKHALDTLAGSVYRLALAHLRNAADAHDFVQAVFLSLLESTVEFHDDAHMKAWLLHVTANRCREYHRSAWRRRVESTDDVASFAESAVCDPGLEALFEHPVWAALAHLPEKLRIVVHLHDVEGYSTEAIADILGILPATVRTRLHRGRKQLRENLGANEQAAIITTKQKGANHEPQPFR